jgi:hypothetical protein
MTPSIATPAVLTVRSSLWTKLQKIIVLIGLLWLPTFGGICDPDSSPVTPEGTGHQSSIIVTLSGPVFEEANVLIDGKFAGEVSNNSPFTKANVEPNKTYVITLDQVDRSLSLWDPKSVAVKPETNHTVGFTTTKPVVKVNLGTECIGTINGGEVRVDGVKAGDLLPGGQVRSETGAGPRFLEFFYGTGSRQSTLIDAKYGGTYTWNINC